MNEDEFEAQAMDFDEENNTDVKINPDFYIHQAIVMAQKSLLFSNMKGNFKDGVSTYRVFIEQIEVLCKSAKYLTEDYDGKVNAFLKSQEYAETTEPTIKMSKLSNAKLGFLLEEIFGRTALKSPLCLK